jgi:hypothetical protein
VAIRKNRRTFSTLAKKKTHLATDGLSCFVLRAGRTSDDRDYSNRVIQVVVILLEQDNGANHGGPYMICRVIILFFRRKWKVTVLALACLLLILIRYGEVSLSLQSRDWSVEIHARK